ncbi:MAG TPA: class I SAM-dependent methyltransferase [Iamia sp.]|nr:class I SAM-dependent methyltransferase [Iamia sp.]
MEDWVRWHEAYDDPDSSLARRLVVVRRRIAEALDALGSRAQRILSLCAGDGRDLLPVLALRPLAARPPDGRPGAVLVENDPTLAAQAQRRARTHGLANVRVLVGDASNPGAFADALPADLLLLCGIFGNISRPDIEATVGAVPALLAPGRHVIWTCGAADPDLRPAIRRLFTDAGLDETSFDGHPEHFGVGAAHLPDTSPTVSSPLPDRLFTFLR